MLFRSSGFLGRELRPDFGHVEAAVAGEPGQHHVTETKDGSLPPCRNVSRQTSAHLSKFVLYPSTPFYELRKVMGTSKLTILVPLFYLKFLSRIRRLWSRNFKWAALASKGPIFRQTFDFYN